MDSNLWSPYVDQLSRRLQSRSILLPNGCIQWTGAMTPKGYGMIRLTSPVRKCMYVHRLAWILRNGEIGTGIEICHSCDNPGCLNYYHLFAGTKSDNMRDMVRKGRSPDKRGERSGKAKIKESDVIEMQKMRTYGLGLVDIGATYGIHPSHVSRILSGARWGHVGRGVGK